MLKVASSTSTKTGVAPVRATASPVAQKVKDGHSTASPGPTPFAIKIIKSASVPLEQVTTCLALEKAASAASSKPPPSAREEPYVYQVALTDDKGNIMAVQQFDKLEDAKAFAADVGRWQAQQVRPAGSVATSSGL